MAWTIKLAFAVLLTSLTGSIVLLVWHFIGKGLEWLGYLPHSCHPRHHCGFLYLFLVKPYFL